MKEQDIDYFDGTTKQVETSAEAYSKVVKLPHNFQFFIKYSAIFGNIKWKFHHRSSTYGSWMFPDGLPPRNDEKDNMSESIKHRDELKSTWNFVYFK